MEKKQILDRWTQARDAPYIAATTALAESFDYPHVRLVMNVDEPESLVNLCSRVRSGRARWQAGVFDGVTPSDLAASSCRGSVRRCTEGAQLQR